MSEKMPAPPQMRWEQYEKLRERAKEKARDVNFSTQGNPLAYVTPAQAYAKQRIRANMEALEVDAERRSNPATGIIYSGIMDMRYGG